MIPSRILLFLSFLSFFSRLLSFLAASYCYFTEQRLLSSTERLNKKKKVLACCIAFIVWRSGFCFSNQQRRKSDTEKGHRMTGGGDFFYMIGSGSSDRPFSVSFNFASASLSSIFSALYFLPRVACHNMSVQLVFFSSSIRSACLLSVSIILSSCT